MSVKSRNKNSTLKAVILAGSSDFGRCSLAMHLLPALWPIAGKPALERLLEHLWAQGIRQTVICCNGDSTQLKKALSASCPMELDFLTETLPLGTAGCLRDASAGWSGTLLVLPAAAVSPPDIGMLLRDHRAGKSDLTVVFNPPAQDTAASWDPADIYVCRSEIIDYIPGQGYCDIKETLIPIMVRAGKTVHAVRLPKAVGKFRDAQQYLHAVRQYFSELQSTGPAQARIVLDGSKKTWISDIAKLGSNVHVFGPAIIMDGADISEDTVIFGPAIIGRGVRIGRNTLVQNSVLWDGSSVGSDCRLSGCVLAYNAVVGDVTALESASVISSEDAKLKGLFPKTFSELKKTILEQSSRARMKFQSLTDKYPAWLRPEKRGLSILLLFCIFIFTCVFLWSYWPELTGLWYIWQGSDEYSSGLLVPFLAGYILWARRGEIASTPQKPAISGLVLLVMAQLMRYFGLFFMYSSAERLSLIVSIAAVILLIFGWRLFRKLLPIILFLCLMLPLPRSVHSAVMLPLQNFATVSSVFFLELMGYEPVRQGNIIYLNGSAVAVAEACNGLRMVTAFFVIIGLVVLIAKRSWWEKMVVLLSGLPIALLCNVVRLTTTAIVFTKISGENFESIFHDFGGYAMMPLALAIVLFEFWFLTKLTTESQEPERRIIFHRSVACSE